MQPLLVWVSFQTQNCLGRCAQEAVDGAHLLLCSPSGISSRRSHITSSITRGCIQPSSSTGVILIHPVLEDIGFKVHAIEQGTNQRDMKGILSEALLFMSMRPHPHHGSAATVAPGGLQALQVHRPPTGARRASSPRLSSSCRSGCTPTTGPPHQWHQVDCTRRRFIRLPRGHAGHPLGGSPLHVCSGCILAWRTGMYTRVLCVFTVCQVWRATCGTNSPCLCGLHKATFYALRLQWCPGSIFWVGCGHVLRDYVSWPYARRGGQPCRTLPLHAYVGCTTTTPYTHAHIQAATTPTDPPPAHIGGSPEQMETMFANTGGLAVTEIDPIAPCRPAWKASKWPTLSQSSAKWTFSFLRPAFSTLSLWLT